MQSKSVKYLTLGIMLCLVSIIPSMADTDFQGTVYQWANWNAADVQNGPPTEDTTFTIGDSVVVTYLDSYHWNNGKGVDSPGTITLKNDDGTKYGPFRMKGLNGQGGALNVIWSKTLDSEEFVLKPGTYTIIDSDPATWASNSGSNGAGFFGIKWETYYPPKPAVPIESSTSSGLAGEWSIFAKDDVYPDGVKGQLSLTKSSDKYSGVLLFEARTGHSPESLSDISVTGSSITFTRKTYPETKWTGEFDGENSIKGTFTKWGVAYPWSAVRNN
jgi:hypothetical protein